MAQPRKPKFSSSHLRAPGGAKDPALSDFAERLLLEKFLRQQLDLLLSKTYPLRQHLLVDLANLRGEDAIDWFWQKRRFMWPESPPDLIELRDELRRVWDLDDATTRSIVSPPIDVRRYTVSANELSADETLNKWLRWRPSAEQAEIRRSLDRELGASVLQLASVQDMRREIFGGQDPPDIAQLPSPSVDIPFRCSLYSRRLEPEQRNIRSMLIQGIFEHWGHLKFCANSACLSPYFIAKRKDQTVCDSDICKSEKQRQHALKWWRENRAKKSQKEAVGKATKKGSKENVTRKAR
jgi:hypothetical protein